MHLTVLQCVEKKDNVTETKYFQNNIFPIFTILFFHSSNWFVIHEIYFSLKFRMGVPLTRMIICGKD